MPRDTNKKPVEAALDRETEYPHFHDYAQDHGWSDKKLAEKIVLWWMFDKGLIKEPKGRRP